MSVKEYSLFKLRFASPFHIGNNRDDYGTSLRSVSSDSFYAALVSTLSKLEEDIPKGGDLGCVISSLFPFYQQKDGSNTALFFPLPLSSKVRVFSGSVSSVAKQFKSAQWIDKDLFQSVLSGKRLNSNNSFDHQIKGLFISDRQIDERFIQSDIVERVSVSRRFEESRPFYMERISFTGRSGLFFLAEGDTSYLDKTMHLLALEGIGTDRNVGNGQFDFEKSLFQIEVPDNAEYGMSLSTFIPENAEQLDKCLYGEKCAYELIRRGGWITDPGYQTIRKNAIYGFSAGSVFHGLSSGSGKIADLAPSGLINHPVWRCGKALVVPISFDNE